MTTFLLGPSPHLMAPPAFSRERELVVPRKLEVMYQERESGIQPEVVEEVDYLRREGFDVNIVDNPPRLHDPTRIDNVRIAVEETLGQHGDGIVDYLTREEVHPTAKVWAKLRKRAASLEVMYSAGEDVPSLGGRVDASMLYAPLFPGRRSAVEIIRANKPNKAEAIIRSYGQFFDPSSVLADGKDEYGFTSGDYLQWVQDSREVVARSDMMVRLGIQHLSAKTTLSKKMSIVAMACGGASPDFELARAIRDNWDIKPDLHLVDIDPMAIGSAHGLAGWYGIEEEQIHTHLEDLVKTPPTQYIEPRSADILEFSGLAEYFPAIVQMGPLGYRMLEHYISSVAELVRPGGLMLLGNMLSARPQQDFFSKVWPPLYQRSIGNMLSIIEHTGFDPRNVRVDVSRGGVYAMYALRFPEDRVFRAKHPVGQRLGYQAMKYLAPEY